MKKVLFTIAAAVMMLAATSCKKENINEPENFNREPEANEFLATIDGGMQQNAPAVKDGMGTMATFDHLNVMWQQGDQINVNGTTFTCNSSPETNDRAYFENGNPFHANVYHAFYSTTIDPTSMQINEEDSTEVAGKLKAVQYYNPARQAENLPMHAYSTDHWLNFHNICAAIKIYVPCTAHHIVISNTSARMNGDFTVQNNVAVMSVANLTDDEKKITIYKGTEGHTEDFHACDSLFIAIPGGSYEGFEIAFYENATDATPIYTTGPTAQGKNLSVTANKIYRIVGYKYTDVLPGKFSVASNKQVQFTVGNLLRTNTTPHTYIFEDKQTGYRSTKLEQMTDGKSYYGYYNDCQKSYTVNGTSYDIPIESEMIYLLRCGKRNGSTNTTTPTLETNARPNAARLYAFAKVNDGANVTLCLLVAPDGATAFDTARHEYTLKEVNSMGLLCLPMAGYVAAGGSGATHSKATSDRPDGNIICARYWAPTEAQAKNNTTGIDKHFLQVDILNNSLSPSEFRINYGKTGTDGLSRTIRLVKVVQ